MSILFAIGRSHRGRHTRLLRAASAREEGVRPIIGEGDGSEAASAASWQGSYIGARRMNAAVLLEANLDLRLEHKLQTAMGRQRVARPQFRSIAHGMARDCSSGFPAAGTRFAHEVPAVLILKGVGVALRRQRRPVRWRVNSIEPPAPERFESGVRLAPVIFIGEPNPADVTGCPNATQPEPFTVSVLFLRPRTGNWQVACEIWRQGGEFRGVQRSVPRTLKFRLTTRP